MIIKEFHRMRIIKNCYYINKAYGLFLWGKKKKSSSYWECSGTWIHTQPWESAKMYWQQALVWAHLCLQKTHRRLSFLVCEAFFQSRSKLSIKRWGLCGPNPSLCRSCACKPQKTKIKANVINSFEKPSAIYQIIMLYIL